MKSTSILTPESETQDPSTHPPTTNRGVENPLHERIDWISFTLPIDAKGVWPDDMDKVSTITKSFNGYDTAKEYADGRIELTSSIRPDMGIHCVLSGTTCSNCRANLQKILELCWLEGGKVTRFDLALDDDMGRIHPRDATEYIRRGEIICRAKEYPIRDNADKGGYTQYCGKMASEVHVCLYEKSAEQGVCGFTVRCEIRFKGRKANKAAQTYLCSNDCRGLVLGFVKFPNWIAWNEVFASTPIQLPTETSKSRRVAWLLGQVSKSIALEITERQGDMVILELIRESVMAHISDLRHELDKEEGIAI